MNPLQIANNLFGRKNNNVQIMMKQNLFNSSDYVSISLLKIILLTYYKINQIKSSLK